MQLSIRDRLNQHQSHRITLLNSFASPYQYQTLASCITVLPYSAADLAGMPKQATRSINSTSSGLNLYQNNGNQLPRYHDQVPNPSGFCSHHPGHLILLREAGNAQNSHQGREGDEPGS
jgi:hypothetical protein